MSGPGRVAVWGMDGSAGEAGGGEEEEEEGETAAHAHAHSARLATSLLFSRLPSREPRREARARRPCSSSMAILFFEDDEASRHFFLPLVRQAVGWDLLLPSVSLSV